MKHCPRCGRDISWIRNSTYGGDVTFYHWCVDQHALVRPDGTVATQAQRHLFIPYADAQQELKGGPNMIGRGTAFDDVPKGEHWAMISMGFDSGSRRWYYAFTTEAELKDALSREQPGQAMGFKVVATYEPKFEVVERQAEQT